MKTPTRGGNTLDLVLTNLNPFYLSDSIIVFPPFDLSDHSVIPVSHRLRDPKANQKKVVYKRDMTPSRKAMFGQYLSEIDWSFLDSIDSVEVKTNCSPICYPLDYIIYCLKNAFRFIPMTIRGSTRIYVVSYNFDSVPFSSGMIPSSNSI